MDSVAAFCYICMRASKEGKLLTSTKQEPAYISKGFVYWKVRKQQFLLISINPVIAIVKLMKQ